MCSQPVPKGIHFGVYASKLSLKHRISGDSPLTGEEEEVVFFVVEEGTPKVRQYERMIDVQP